MSTLSSMSHVVIYPDHRLHQRQHHQEHVEKKKQLVWMRGLLVVFIAISALIALFQYHSSVVFIAQLMGYSWGALAGSFLGPFLGPCIPGAFRRRACGARSPWVWA